MNSLGIGHSTAPVVPQVQEYHLFSDPAELPLRVVSSFGQPLTTAQARHVLMLPDGVAFVVAPSHELSRLEINPPDNFADSLIFESFVDHRGRSRLLLLNPAGGALRVNDQAAPRLAILHELDQVQLGQGPAMHVTVFNRPIIGPPDPSLAGRECLVCRVPFTSASKSYTCSCGAGLHLEDGNEADGALKCALLIPECPRCKRSIVLTEGYSALPDFCHG